MQNQLNLYKKRGYQIIIIGFVGFFLWAGLYQINQGVYSQGFIVSKNEAIDINTIEDFNLAKKVFLSLKS